MVFISLFDTTFYLIGFIIHIIHLDAHRNIFFLVQEDFLFGFFIVVTILVSSSGFSLVKINGCPIFVDCSNTWDDFQHLKES